METEKIKNLIIEDIYKIL